MGRIYRAVKHITGVTTAIDLLEINASATAMVVVHKLSVAALGVTVPQQLELTVKTGHTSSGSGGSAVTAVPDLIGDAAFGGTVEAGNGTRATGGTIVSKMEDAFDVLAGWAEVPTPETRYWIPVSGRFIFGLETVPTGSTDFTVTAIIEEIG